MLGCAAILTGVAAAARRASDSGWVQWGMLAALLLAMSADEASGLHELLVFPLRALVDDNPWLRYPLILPGLGAIGALWFLFGGFVRSLPIATRRGICAAALLFAAGALVFETIGGWFDPTLYGPNVPYVLLATIEEGCEMFGVIFLLTTLLRHIEAEIGPLRVDIRQV